MMTDLHKALSIFRHDFDLTRDQNLWSLNREVRSGNISLSGLKNDLIAAVSDPEFDWLALAEETKLLEDSLAYTQIDVLDYVKYLIWEFLFPEYQLDIGEESLLRSLVLECVKAYEKDDGWISYYTLYDCLKLKYQFDHLEFFHMYHIYSILHSDLEPRFDNLRSPLQGFLRYKGKSSD